MSTSEAKPVLVGESNPYGGADEFALYPSPVGCAGHRLCHLVLGLGTDTYLDRFERRNLLQGKWSVPAARKAAEWMREAYAGHKLILLGSKVSAAFGVSFEPLVTNGAMLVLPHPSGLCRWWQTPGAFMRARSAVEEFLR